MRVKVFRDSEGNELAVCRTKREAEAADDHISATIGYGERYTATIEERDTLAPLDVDDESDDGRSARHYPSIEGGDE